MKIIIFDTETNGFANCSLLSICAIKAEIKNNKLNKIDLFERYYFPETGEKYNPYAIKVNGLVEGKIKELRGAENYSEQFSDDSSSFYEFVKDCDGFIAHNIAFDRKFIPFTLWGEYCTLKNSPTFDGSKLMDLADHYRIKISTDKLHSAVYDTEVLFDIVEQMLIYNDGDIHAYVQQHKHNPV